MLCFELFGYDFIIDKEFRPWILEINDNPGLGISSPVIEKIIPRMLDDDFRMLYLIQNIQQNVLILEIDINQNSNYKDTLMTKIYLNSYVT